MENAEELWELKELEELGDEGLRAKGQGEKDRNDLKDPKDLKDLKDENIGQEGQELKMKMQEEELQENEYLEEEEPGAEGFFKKVLLLMEDRRFQEAQKLLQGLLDGKHEDISESLSLLCLLQMAQLEYWMGNYANAESLAALLLREEDDYCREFAYEILARVALDRFDFKLAEQYERKLPYRSLTRYMIRAFVSIRRGDIRGAEKILHAVETKITPDDPEYQIAHAFLDILRGDTVAALGKARGLLREENLSVPLQLLLSELFIDAGFCAEADMVLRNVEAACPQHPGVPALKAQLSFRKGDVSQAMTFAQEALSLNPQNQKIRALMVALALQSGNFDSAQCEAQQMVDECPQAAVSQMSLGHCFYAKGQYLEARKAYEASFVWGSRDSVLGRFCQGRIALVDEEIETALCFFEPLKGNPVIPQDMLQEDLERCYEAMEDEEQLEQVGQEFALVLFFERKQREVMEMVVGE